MLKSLILQVLALLNPVGPEAKPVIVKPVACETLTACSLEFNGSEGRDIYRCFDKAGQEVLRTRADRASQAMSCNPAQLKSLQAAYANPCYFRESQDRLVPGLLPHLLDMRQMPETICYSIDRRQASFEAGGSRYRLETFTTSGGGNARGTQWTLSVSPASRTLLRQQAHPWLGCPSFQAAKYCGWRISLGAASGSLVLRASDIAPPCRVPFEWSDVFNRLDRDAQSCRPLQY